MKKKLHPTGRIARPLLAALSSAFALTGFAASPTYPAAVTGDGALGYYRLNDSLVRGTVNVNQGSLGASGNATNDLPTGVVHPFTSAIVGDPNGSSFFDFTSRTEIPFNPALNRPNTEPFTIEAWFYPATDQTATGMGALANRWTQGGNRQGWVMYQRRPNSDYNGSEGVGWEFRMYDDRSTSTALDVVSGVPYQVGKWQHVVIVYDPVQVFNATLSIYIDGVLANTTVWGGGSDGTQSGYGPCTGNHDPAPNGQPAMALGNYNNSNSGTLGAANPWFGGIDEFAYYPAKLTAAEILAHYQNGTNANRTTPYSTLVKSKNPSVYLRLDEIAAGADIAVNLGDTRNAGNAKYTAEARHPATSALAGRTDDGSAAFHMRNGKSSLSMPWLAANNPNAGIPFTFETWLRPMRDTQGGQCPVNNRMVGGTGRTGWVIFQRNPDLSYPSSEGHGWNFRMYTGQGNGGQDVTTDTDYVVGRWQHLVVTWEPQTQNGDVAGNGNDQWQGILTAYVDGQQVAQNENALYSANRETPETANTPADLAVGSYNAASGLGSNPYEGDVDELAIYNNYVLTPEQILAHYQAGTNAHPDISYDTQVFTAGFTGPERVGLPATYLRFTDGAYYPAANSGSLAGAANGSLVLSPNNATGPTVTGFEADNAAVRIDGKNWVSLGNPAGLNFGGQITLEAWIKPDAAQGGIARILSHGPATPTSFDVEASGVVLAGSLVSSNEVSLRIDGGTEYVVGSSDGSTEHSTRFTVGTDLGSGQWVHLVGTYDGSKWNLYRNGALVASTPDSTGALLVADGDWAIGSTGNGWADSFAGSIDEVAIYRTALTPGKVQAHYSGGAVQSKLSIASVGNGYAVSWNAGTLQQSDTVNGTYTDVAGAASPYTIPVQTTKKFYRTRQ